MVGQHCVRFRGAPTEVAAPVVTTTTQTIIAGVRRERHHQLRLGRRANHYERTDDLGSLGDDHVAAVVSVSCVGLTAYAVLLLRQQQLRAGLRGE